MKTEPSWKEMSIKSHAKYLGFQIGPGVDNQNEKAVINKYKSRINGIRQLGLGMAEAIRMHNTIASPVTSYIQQLISFGWNKSAQLGAVASLLKNPCSAFTYEAICNLDKLGLSTNIATLHEIGEAARIRTAYDTLTTVDENWALFKRTILCGNSEGTDLSRGLFNSKALIMEMHDAKKLTMLSEETQQKSTKMVPRKRLRTK